MNNAYVNPLDVQINDALEILNDKYPAFSGVHEVIYESLREVIDKNPDCVIKIISDTFRNELLTPFLTEAKIKHVKTYLDKLSFISLNWELAELYKLLSYLLSSFKVPIHNLESKKAIFKQFKALGIEKNDIENMRLIRNSMNHKFGFSKEKLISDGFEISLPEIDEIYVKLSDVQAWSIGLFTLLMFFIPKFGMLLLYTVMIKTTTLTRKEIKEYIQSVNEFIPELFEKSMLYKIKKFNKMIYRKLRIYYNKLLNYQKFFFSEYIVHFSKFINRNPLEVALIAGQLSDALIDVEHKRYFLGFASRIQERSTIYEVFTNDDWKFIID